jgi:predicted transcriptional regulator
VSALTAAAPLQEAATATAPIPRRSIQVDASTDDQRALELLKALANETRMSILSYLGDRVVPVNRIARDLGLPASTATMHVAVLAKAGLLHTRVEPAVRGLQKVCSRTYDELVIELPRGMHHTRDTVDLSMPIGGFSDFEVEPTCGLAGPTTLIGYLDDPNSFYEPARLDAQLLWFASGYVEYRFPHRVPHGSRIDALQVSAEVCSEAPLSDPDWPSDLSLWVNDAHLGTWTSLGDFGGRRGRLTPAWWPTEDSQYGVLKRWRVGPAGTSIDGIPLSTVTIDQLGLSPGSPIRIRFGVVRGAGRGGGLNIFGRGFGNYPQDIVLRLEYDDGGASPSTGDEAEEAGPN